MLKDPYGRIVDYLRISITQLCNFQCIYCHKEGENYNHKSRELALSDVEKIVKVAAQLGFKKVKITGGEPLVRKDIVEVVRRISCIDGIEDLSLTTNGYFLSNYATKLKKAGLTRVNISLPALNREKFKYITGVDGLPEVLEGIEAAIEAGLEPVKINVPVLKDLNEDEVWRIISYAEKLGVDVQLIEYHSPDPFSEEYLRFHVSLKPIVKKLEEISVGKVVRPLQARPVYLLRGRIKVELVEPMFNPLFCLNCRKLRVTSDGKFKPCFFRNDNLVDAMYALNGLPEELSFKELEKLFFKAVSLKRPYFGSSPVQ